MAESSGSGGGLSIASVLFLIFVTLKLAEVGPVADWSWWWVTSPLWISAAILGAILVILGIIAGVDIIQQKRMQRLIRKSK